MVQGLTESCVSSRKIPSPNSFREPSHPSGVPEGSQLRAGHRESGLAGGVFQHPLSRSARGETGVNSRVGGAGTKTQRCVFPRCGGAAWVWVCRGRLRSLYEHLRPFLRWLLAGRARALAAGSPRRWALWFLVSGPRKGLVSLPLYSLALGTAAPRAPLQIA